MLTLYHGTTKAIALQLMGCQVNLLLGGGEFGQGFYLGDSRRLAKRRAFHKSGLGLGTAANAMNSKDNTFEVTLDLLVLGAFYTQQVLNRAGARALFARLKAAKKTASYHSPSDDLIVGPVAGRKGRYLCVTQYKFDSAKSGDVLNKQCLNVPIQTKII